MEYYLYKTFYVYSLKVLNVFLTLLGTCLCKTETKLCTLLYQKDISGMLKTEAVLD